MLVQRGGGLDCVADFSEDNLYMFIVVRPKLNAFLTQRAAIATLYMFIMVNGRFRRRRKRKT